MHFEIDQDFHRFRLANIELLSTHCGCREDSHISCDSDEGKSPVGTGFVFAYGVRGLLVEGSSLRVQFPKCLAHLMAQVKRPVVSITNRGDAHRIEPLLRRNQAVALRLNESSV